MKVVAVKTRKLLPPQDDLLEVLSESITELKEESVVAVSSKAVAIWQGRCVPIDLENKIAQKEALIRAEADRYLEADMEYPYPRMFTVYEGVFTSSAGIDESNSNDHFTLLPRDVDKTASDIREFLLKKFSIRKLGVIIVDSRTEIMRNGVVGVALGHAGFLALHDYRGKSDIFGRQLQYERLNIADCLATTATLSMGEGDECTPVAIFTDIPHITYGHEIHDDSMLAARVSLEDDVFAQFISTSSWKEGDHGNKL